MPYDPDLAERIRSAMAGLPRLNEKRMFGGIGWMVDGHMAAGASSRGQLIVRAGKEESVAFAEEPGASLMQQRGAPMRGWIVVEVDHVSDDAALQRWLDRGIAHARSMPPK